MGLRERRHVDFSRPGKPTDTAFVESFNGRLRDECLNAHSFLSIENARSKIEDWRRQYNESRPYTSLGWKTPQEYWRRRKKLPREARRLIFRSDENRGDPQLRLSPDQRASAHHCGPSFMPGQEPLYVLKS